MIQPFCDHCGDELNEEGGIIVSPPDVVGVGTTRHVQKVWKKIHICAKCYRDLEEWIMTPQGGNNTMISLCQDIVQFDKRGDFDVKKDWDLLVQRAKQAITYKGGGTIPR